MGAQSASKVQPVVAKSETTILNLPIRHFLIIRSMSEREDSAFGFAMATQRDRSRPLVRDMPLSTIVQMVAAGEK
jgi:hypothetical protein